MYYINNICIFYMYENIQGFCKYIINYKWLLFASLFSALTIILVNCYIKYRKTYILFITVLCDFALIYSYIMLLEKNDMLTCFVLIKILSVLIVLFVGIMFWDDKLTKSKIIGLIFALISIYLLA